MTKTESVTTTNNKLEEVILSLIRLTGACRTKGISKSQIEEGIQGNIRKLEDLQKCLKQ